MYLLHFLNSNFPSNESLIEFLLTIFQYHIKLTSDENKEKYQLGDQLIQNQILIAKKCIVVSKEN